MHLAAPRPVLPYSDLPRRCGLGRLRLIRFALVAGLAFSVLLVPHLLWTIVTRRARSPMARWFLAAAAAGAGLRINSKGARFHPGALIVANHVSWADILVLGSAASTVFVARADVRRWPAIGLLARLGGTLFVERQARTAVRGQVEAVAAALTEGSVVLFPEGTTGNGHDVLPFRPALIEAAAGRPVQPVLITYAPNAGSLADFAWDGDKLFLPHLLAVLASGGARCRIKVLPPLEPGSAHRKARALRARAMLRAELQKSRHS